MLFVNHSSVIGGAETNLLDILRFANYANIDPVAVLLPGDGPLATEVRRLGLPVGFISYHSLELRNPLRYCQALSQLVSWIRRSQASVLHLNHQWLIEHIVMAGSLTRRPVVCHVRNLLDAEFATQHRRWFRLASSVVVESHAVETRTQELGISDQLTLIHNGIDIRRFLGAKNGSDYRRELTISAEAPVIGFCGRIVPQKGPEDLIRATPAILAAEPDAHIVLCGVDRKEGAYSRALQKQARHLGIESRVHFLGFRHDVENILVGLNVLALPSRRAMAEGLPLSMLEGLAAGCLVVATPNSGIPEVIHNGRTGFLVAPGDPASLADGIVRALSLPKSNQQLIRRNGKALVASEFTVESQVSRLGELYKDLTS